MSTAHYLIVGDLHGRILSAFRLAMRWEREHGIRLDGLLQVGDLGYFPDTARLDKATARHPDDDPLELGTSLLVEPDRESGGFSWRRRPTSDPVIHGGQPRGLRRLGRT